MNPKLRLACCFSGGILLGIFLHYILFRISLPVQPFIYFAF